MQKRINKLLIRTGYRLFPFIIAFGCLIYGYSQKGWNSTFINGDGKGYYAYLPAIFIYHDLSFGFIEKYELEHYLPGQKADFRQSAKGGTVNRYYAGTALVQLPFFLVTHSVCKLLKLDADGYSPPYQYSILIAACFYLFIGLWALFTFLNHFFPQGINILILVCITFSTPLLFYTIYNPDFSHIYSFAFVSLFIQYAYQYFREPSEKRVYLLFLLLGIITLIRPVNIIIVLILPFLASDWKNFSRKMRFLFRNYRIPAISALIFSLVIFLQLSIYKIQTGHFIVYSYGDARFDFLHSHFTDFLFSYRKGMFLYTPLLLLSMGGFISLYKESVYKFFALLLFLVAVIYALSSWSVWTYGMTYGQRPVIEYYFVFAILMGYFPAISGKKIWPSITLVLMTAMIAHNLLQISQHRHYILHWDEMDKDKYWKVFLRTDPVYYGYLWNSVTPVQDDISGYASVAAEQSDGADHSGFLLKPGQTVLLKYYPEVSPSDSLYFLLSMNIIPESERLKKNQLHIMTWQQSTPQDGFAFDITMRNLEPRKWNRIAKKIALLSKNKQDEVLISLINKGRYNFQIRNMQIMRRE